MHIYTMTDKNVVLFMCLCVYVLSTHVQVVGMGGDCVGGWNIYRAYIFPQNAKLFFGVGWI